MITGRDVVAFRARRHMSRRALAQECGLTEGKIWRIENKGVIHDDERRALELTGVTATGEEVGGSPPPSAPEPVALIGRNDTVAATIDDLRQPAVHVDVREPDRGELDVHPVDLSRLSRIAALKYDRYISNSELQSFKRCRRKWWLTWHRGLTLKKESPVGVKQVGSRIHEALKTHYVPGWPRKLDQVLDELERLITIDRSNLTEDIDPDTLKKFENEANLQRIMLEGYVAWVQEKGADAELEVVSSEQYLEAPLTEFEDVAVAIIGKIDVRVRRTLDGVRLFIDHKTVADVRQPTLLLPLDEQMRHYRLLELLQDDEPHRCDGALYNMLRRVKRTPTAKPPFYERVEVRHNVHELMNYRRRIVGEITDILDVQRQLDAGASHHTVAYPRPTRDCVWDCPMFAVCPMFDDGSRVEDMLTQHYVMRDPLDYYLNEVIGGTE